MKFVKVPLLVAGLAFFALIGLANDQNQKGKSNSAPAKPVARPQYVTPKPPSTYSSPTNSSRSTYPGVSRPDNSNRPDTARPSETPRFKPQPNTTDRTPTVSRDLPDRPPGGKYPTPPPETKSVRGGLQVTKFNPNGKVTSETVTKKDGTKEIKQFDASGNHVRTSSVVNNDGRKETTHNNLMGRKQDTVVEKDGRKETHIYAPNGKERRTVVVENGQTNHVNFHYDRHGEKRATETIKFDDHGAISKTVAVKQSTLIFRKTTIVNNTIFVKNYDRGRFGFVYHPVPIIAVGAPLLVLSPYWYTPENVVIVHPFRFDWGWRASPWYAHHRFYCAEYDVYPEPSYWVTDYVVAGYAADHYEASTTPDQAKKELGAARDDAKKAAAIVKQDDDLLIKMTAGRDPGTPEDEALIQTRAELAEAKAAQIDAENRAKNAETQLASAKMTEGKAKGPNPKETPIDQATKDDLRIQIAAEIAAQKESQGQSERAVPDLAKSLADPKHVYLVASSVPVVFAENSNSAGNVTEGDLLKLEPGQENDLKNADANTLVKMRVMSSKGEPGEVTAGAVISVPLKTIQEFDNEFHAKLDQGLIAANQNQDQFKKGVQ